MSLIKQSQNLAAEIVVGLATLSFGASARTAADEPTPLPPIVPQAEHFPAPVEFGTATETPARAEDRDAQRTKEIMSALAAVKAEFLLEQSDPERWTLRREEYQQLWRKLATAVGVSDQQLDACQTTKDVALSMAGHGVYVIIERSQPANSTGNFSVTGLALLINPEFSVSGFGHTVLKPTQVVTVVEFDPRVAQLRDVASTGVVSLRQGPVTYSTVNTAELRAPFLTQSERTPEQQKILDRAYGAGYHRIDFSNITVGFTLGGQRYHISGSDVFRTVTYGQLDGRRDENVGADIQVPNMVPVGHLLLPGQTFIALRGPDNIVRFWPVNTQTRSTGE